MSQLIACHATDSLGTMFVQEGEDDFIVETCNDAGFCLWYKRLSNIQDGWDEYHRQVANPSNPYALEI